jgi:hypothetical protein
VYLHLLRFVLIQIRINEEDTIRDPKWIYEGAGDAYGAEGFNWWDSSDT